MKKIALKTWSLLVVVSLLIISPISSESVEANFFNWRSDNSFSQQFSFPSFDRFPNWNFNRDFYTPPPRFEPPTNRFPSWPNPKPHPEPPVDDKPMPPDPDPTPDPDPDPNPTPTPNPTPSTCPLSSSELRDVRNLPSRTNGPIIAFGDSLTEGVGASNGQDYVSELERRGNVNIINAGVSGDNTEDALDRLNRDVLSRNPSTVLVWLGGNDILERYYADLIDEIGNSVPQTVIDLILDTFDVLPDPDDAISERQTFRNLERIVNRIQSRGANVILIGLDGGQFDENLSGRYEAIAEDTDSIYVEDVLDGILGRPGLTSDLIHPNNQGYDIVANRILPFLTCVL